MSELWVLCINTDLLCSDDVSYVQGKVVEKEDSVGYLKYGSRLVRADWRSVLLTADC